MPMVKTAKFGGSSLSDADQFRKVAAILQADPTRRFVVVSAPGKRFSGDDKITDLLYRCADLSSRREDFSPAFGPIRERFLSIERDLSIESAHISEALDEIEAELGTGRASRDYVASRGEYLCAKLMGAYLHVPMVDAAQLIRFTEDGELDMETTACYCAPLKDLPRAVIPGFYGAMPDGSIRTFSRGGSDITGAIIARAVGADEYENWTDVDGFMMADPRIVPEARTMHAVSYEELRELSYMGASVLHEESIFPVREARIPIHVRNTNHPEASGTWIVNEGTLMKEHRHGLVAGISGRKGFTMITLTKENLHKQVGFGYGLLKILDRHNISFETMPCGIDVLTVVLNDADIKGKMDILYHEIRTELKPDTVEIASSIALIATVGRGMARTAGVAARLFTALQGAGVSCRIIDQSPKEMNLIVGVDQRDFENAVRAIYRAFCE
ncbi:MAG: aspartate kinase [Clostridia bacterium]|nr:aspartate kinase [Clostridia bacterium]